MWFCSTCKCYGLSTFVLPAPPLLMDAPVAPLPTPMPSLSLCAPQSLALLCSPAPC